MTKEIRDVVLTAAEAVVGSKLPGKLRALLTEQGEAWFKPPEGVGADSVFKLSLKAIFNLSDTDTGAAIFADQQGNPILELGGWDSDAEGWEYTEGAFLVLDNQCGDTVLLARDETGVARRLVFCNHETYELELWADDIDQLLGMPDDI